MQESDSLLGTLSFAIEHISGISAALSLILAGTCLSYFSYRARSFLFIRDRLWKLIGGKTEFHTAVFEKLRREARELEHFRMEFRVPAETVDEAERFISWQSTSKIPTSKIALAHRHIDWHDFSRPKIKTKYIKQKAILLVFLACSQVLLGGLSLIIATSKYAIVNFPDSPIFYLSQNEFKFKLFSHSLNSESCKNDKALKAAISESNFPLNQAIAICASITDSKNTEKISRIFREQRSSSAVLFSIAIFYFFIFFYELIKLSAAQEIKKKMEQQAISTCSDS
ncbi:DUF6216 family protein [Pseudomonas delhiensis]|uniref:DUF6216 family protein n=1 Tax=Pseudomonas delhiensis TaxID=366289 RepID=UPI00315A075D